LQISLKEFIGLHTLCFLLLAVCLVPAAWSDTTKTEREVTEVTLQPVNKEGICFVM